MSRIPGFIGGFGTVFSRNVGSEDTHNYIIESAPGLPKAQPNHYSRPGIKPFCLTPDGPVRALFSQDGRTFAVGGNIFVEILASTVYIVRGYVSFDIQPATISSNGSGGFQLFIVSGNLGYTFDLRTNVFTQITDTDFPFPCLMGDFIDGYFVALKGQSNEFRFSKLEEGSTWDGLDVDQVSASSNQLVSMVVQNKEIWLAGTKTTEPWADVGVNNNPFQPVQGTQIQMGNAAPWSFIAFDNSVMFIGQNKDGSGIVWRMNGYTPVRVSNFAVENYLAELPRFDDAIAWTYQERGHLYYVLYLPQAIDTLVYDVSCQLWTKFNHWDDRAVQWIPFRGRCHAFGFGRHLVGDRETGQVYEMSQDILTDTVPV